MNPSQFARISILPLALLLSASCSDAEPPGAEVRAAEARPPADDGPFGSSRDVVRAEGLWKDLEDYRSWPAPPGLEDWQPGKSPHGSFVKYFVDEAIAQAPSAPIGDGAIVVKENYSAESEDALVTVTVMQKIRGYAPEYGDWFWVKFGPSGEVLVNADGVSLAGRIAAGSARGCIACHAEAEGDDYLFAND